MKKERFIEITDEVIDLTIKLLERDIKGEQLQTIKIILGGVRSGFYKKIALEKDETL